MRLHPSNWYYSIELCDVCSYRRLDLGFHAFLFLRYNNNSFASINICCPVEARDRQTSFRTRLWAVMSVERSPSVLPTTNDSVATKSAAVTTRKSLRLAASIVGNQQRRHARDAYCPKPGRSAGQNDCGILPSE